MKERQIEDYEVNPYTMFIKPVQYGSKIFTQVYELEDQFLTPFKPLEVIKRSCNYFGVDYESRKRGTRSIIGYSRKLPIVIEPINGLFFFPTTSPNRLECIWISHHHVTERKRIAPQQTLITFSNNQSYLFPVPYTTIESQILRSALLETQLQQRVEGHGKKIFYLSKRPTLVNTSESTRNYQNKKDKE